MAIIIKTAKYRLCDWHSMLDFKGSKRLQRGQCLDVPEGEFTKAHKPLSVKFTEQKAFFRSRPLSREFIELDFLKKNFLI